MLENGCLPENGPWPTFAIPKGGRDISPITTEPIFKNKFETIVDRRLCSFRNEILM